MSQWRDETPALDSRAQITESVLNLVASWLKDSAQIKPSKSAVLLAGVLRDKNGLAFTMSFVDDVVRPEDLKIAARNLKQISKSAPRFLPAPMRLAISVGGFLAPALPWLVVPIARRVLRLMVSHLIIDAKDSKLNAALRRIKKTGASLNVNLLGEAVLGDAEARNRVDRTMRLLETSEIDYISLKVSAAIAPFNPWAFDQAVDLIVERIEPLFDLAASKTPHKFINLDMEEYKDLYLTIAVFKRLLDNPRFLTLRAGIVLQAYLPDAMDALHDLQLWSKARVSRGGAPIKVRIVKGANLPMEIVDAELHDWPLAVVESKRAADSNYKRLVNYSLTTEHLKHIEVGIAGHNLFDIAFAKTLIDSRKISQGVTFEMLLGMAEAQAKVVSDSVGGLLLYTPVVHSNDFDVAIAYLLRRLEESANSENFMSAVFELNHSAELLARETDRFKASLQHLDDDFAPTNRVQNRLELPPQTKSEFVNTPDSDPAIFANKIWAKSILEEAKNFDASDLIAAATTSSEQKLDEAIANAKVAAKAWQTLTAQQRAAKLHQVGDLLEANRAKLIEIMMSEAGKTLEQADPEVSEAIDFAHYYAEQSIKLADIDGANHVAEDIVLVTPPWNFPIAIPAGSTLAALAAGSAVILKPAPQVNGCGAILASVMNEVLPAGILTPVIVDEGSLGRQLIGHKLVDRVVLTGAFDTAKLFKSFNPALKLFAETSGKNAIIVTPSADFDLAVRDVVKSAFGHAGQKCSAASLLILVGSAGRSERLMTQLLDATKSQIVDYPSNLLTSVGPLIEPPSGKLLHGLTELDAGEKWLLEPRQLDESGRLWSPGIRDGVAFGSISHMQEYFGPVLSIFRVKTLDEALRVQNAVDYGLTAGIHSLESKEINHWLDNVQAGNLYVNRSITGAIVQRQPFGGWKKSVIGATAKAGGPNYLLGFGSFTSSPAKSKDAPSVPAAAFLQAIKSQVSSDVFEALSRAASSDAQALRERFSLATDVTGLKVEQNVLRYRKAATSIRIGQAATEFDRYRLMLTAIDSNQPLSVHSLTAAERAALGDVVVTVETTDEWLSGLAARAIERVRVVGEKSLELPVEIAVYQNVAVESGVVELLCCFKEQAISITNHRFGNPLKQDLIQSL